MFAASLLNGFVIQATRLPRPALSAHLVGRFGVAFVFALAGVWPHLGVGLRATRSGVALAIYGVVVGRLLYLTAAVTGAAGVFPMGGAGARGTQLVEATMSVALLTVAVALFAVVAMVWRHGARSKVRESTRYFRGLVDDHMNEGAAFHWQWRSNDDDLAQSRE